MATDLRRQDGQEQRARKRAIQRAVTARRQADRARDQFHVAIRQAADAGATRRELAAALDLSTSRIQQIASEAP
jgi:hypothetical protein